MKFLKTYRILIFILFSLTIFSCSVSIQSVVDNQNPKVYDKLLIVILKPDYFRFFVPNFKTTLEEQLNLYDVDYEILIVEPQNRALELNNNENMISSKSKEGKDLIVYLLPRNVFILDNLIRNFDYEIIGISTESEKEVWKSFMEVKCQFGPTSQKEKIAHLFLNRLNNDGVIKTKN